MTKLIYKELSGLSNVLTASCAAQNIAALKNEAAKEIQDFINSIVTASEKESKKVIESVDTVKKIYNNIEKIVENINNNYAFMQKINYRE